MWHGEGGHCCFFYLRSASQLLPPSPLTDRQFHHSHLQTLIHLQLKNSFSISISTFSPLRKMGLGLVMLGLFCGRVAVSSHWFNMSLHWFVMSSQLFNTSSHWLISFYLSKVHLCVELCSFTKPHLCLDCPCKDKSFLWSPLLGSGELHWGALQPV